MQPPLSGHTYPVAVAAAAIRYLFQLCVLQTAFIGARGRRGHNDLRIEAVAAHPTGSDPSSEPGCGGHNPMIQVFSDVDDTFFCSTASYFGLAGCDKEYGHKVVYPGYTQFVLELSRGPSENNAVLKPGLLSARPANSYIAKTLLPLVKKGGLKLTKESFEAHAFNSPTAWDASIADFKSEVHAADFWLQLSAVSGAGVLMDNNESRSLDAFDWHHSYSGMLGVDKVDDARSAQAPGRPAHADPEESFGLSYEGSWYGQLSDGFIYKWMGTTKFAHMKQFFRQLKDHSRPSAYKDLCVVFIGDNAQGDCDTTAKRMSEFTRGGQLGMKAAFIHTLSCASESQQKCPDASAADSFNGTRAPVLRFRNYLEAASLAKSHNLISEQGFLRVVVAVNTFVSIYCHPEGESVEPRIVSDAGCTDLLRSMAAQGLNGWPQFRGDFPVLKTRSLMRKMAFCGACCDSTAPSELTSYSLMGEDRPYHCREGFRLSHSDTMAANFWPWKPMTASVRDCSMC
mmetsp:Transcript_51169/g.119947  ORF Transcript_51169/g.119947 Transcript_51169/m.119947 type:complete len:512 (+) Transcript_51169:55-1590(+)